jgi:putative nucleotidyltransferase with HDIG domain
LTSILTILALALPLFLNDQTYQLNPGDVAPNDILAPYTLTYESQIKTDRLRQQAEDAVSTVFLPADPGITRRQIENLRLALKYINIVRMDSYATPEQKLSDLQAVASILISNEMGTSLLKLSDARWNAINDESLIVLEKVMRNSVREYNLTEFKRSIPTLIDFSFNQDESLIIEKLVTSFVVPTSIVSQEQTDAAKLAASSSIEPVEKTYVSGETIVQRGQIISQDIWEALEQYGIIKPQTNARSVVSSIVMGLLFSAIAYFYIVRYNRALLSDSKSLSLIIATFLVFLFVTQFSIPDHTVIPYIFPIAAFSLTVTSVFSVKLGLASAVMMGVLSAFGLPNSLDLSFFYIFSAVIGVLILGKGRRVSTFFWAGIAIGLSGTATILIFRLPSALTDWIGLLTLSGAALINGMASAGLTLLLQFLFTQLLGMTTALQLMDISRPDHPLLQYLLQNAPGSYQHSLQVSNLAEQAAKKIGADALLVRVGALYHDVGKSTNPIFFIENQVLENLNPHDDLDPATSSATIINHVIEGVALADKHRLPARISDFIKEHHGTLITRYQYTQAVKAAGDDELLVDMELYRYPGPKPQSKETAILMLADGIEARARAEAPKSEDEIRKLVQGNFSYIQNEGQLDDTDLTFHDLTMISESFINTLKNIYHPRIPYPTMPKKNLEQPMETISPQTRPVKK